MSVFKFEENKIKGVWIIQSYVHEDNRGNFVKNFEKNIFKDNGIDFTCTEDFISRSTKYVIRGMHFQLYHPQVKLVSVICGKVYDVVVDLRKDSETFGSWEGFYLSENNRSSLIIPKGCAHGFLSLSEDSIVSYKCCGKYDKNSDMGIMFNDPDIGIEWPVPDMKSVVLGNRDKRLISFKQFKENFEFEM